MSHPVVRKTAITVALFWLTVFLLVAIQSALNVTVGGVAPEAIRLTLAMTFPFTAGISVLIVGIAYMITRRQSKPEHRDPPAQATM